MILRALALVLLVLLPRAAAAQCGAKRSTCSGCHDGARAAFAAAEPWHADHGFADLCAACHGGDGDAQDVARAHAGLAAPRARCDACHADGAVLVARYAPRPREAVAAPRPSRHGAPLPNTIASVLAGALAAFGGAWIVRRERSRRPP